MVLPGPDPNEPDSPGTELDRAGLDEPVEPPDCGLGEVLLVESSDELALPDPEAGVETKDGVPDEESWPEEGIIVDPPNPVELGDWGRELELEGKVDPTGAPEELSSEVEIPDPEANVDVDD